MTTLPPLPALACVAAALVCCCSCATREERADAAFAELIAIVNRLSADLAMVTSESAAEDAAEVLTERCDELWEALAEVDKWGEDPKLPQEARRRIGEQHHRNLALAVEAALQQVSRLSHHRLYSSPRLEQLARHAYAQFRSTGKHPWPRAVLRGREYRPETRP